MYKYICDTCGGTSYSAVSPEHINDRLGCPYCASSGTPHRERESMPIHAPIHAPDNGELSWLAARYFGVGILTVGLALIFIVVVYQLATR